MWKGRVACACAVAAVMGAAPVFAQSARSMGVVRDAATGKPIKGATVRATNPDAYPSELTSATDDKGRWAMIGLRSGTWTFVIEAPGYLRVEASAPVRVATTQPVVVALGRDPGPVPNALDKNIGQLLKAAAALRDQGRLDQAITSYQDIRTKNPKLHTVGLVLADVYRRKAAQQTDPTLRRAQLELAMDTYGDVLEQDASNTRARAELDAVRAQVATTP